MKISKETKISDLIEKYPFLVDELETINTKFGLLKNKAARMTMGKVATISMAAGIASMSAEALLMTLQKIVRERGAEPIEFNDEDNQRRLETLKEIIREMHKGGDNEKARKTFNELIKGIDPNEIKNLEQQLVMEGMPVAEIQNLCELHVGVFKDALGKSEDVQVPEGHPVRSYQATNRQIEAAIRNVEESLKGLNASTVKKLKPAIEEAFLRVARVQAHYVRKENQLFPFMEKHDITAPPQVMWGVHDQIRNLIKVAAAALAKEDHPAIIKAMAELNHAVTEMIFKEEKILFPMVLQNFTKEDWQEISTGGYSTDYAPKAATGSPVRPASVADKDILPLDTGRMTLTQINAMLKHLPLDISFVNAEDEVMYYSDTKERFFPRMPGVIGRKVQNCHPPKSVNVVQDIVEAFRSGQKDSADFWITLQDKTIYIRYFAVRDDARNYLGTLEVSQDITDIRKIEGEKRLLDWQKK